eukprot:696447-Rhodomonas_salina.1
MAAAIGLRACCAMSGTMLLKRTQPERAVLTQPRMLLQSDAVTDQSQCPVLAQCMLLQSEAVS